MGRTGRGWSAAAVVVAGAVAAGCAGAPPAAPDLQVALSQLRADVADRHAQVQVTNHADDAVQIGAVAVSDPRFVGDAERVVDRSSTVPAGGAVDIRVQLPPMACRDTDADADATVTLELLDAGGAARPVTLPIVDPLGFVAPLHDRECRAAALARAAALEFAGFTPALPPDPAMLRLEITPTGRGEAVVRGVQQTNLLGFGDAARDGAYPLDLAITPDSDSTGVDLPLMPTRCDPHAVQEDKRGTIFDVRVEVDGAPGEIELFVGDDLRGRILTWVADWCGFGDG